MQANKKKEKENYMSKMSELDIQRQELEMARTYVVNEVSVPRDEFIMRLSLSIFNNAPEVTDFRSVIDTALKDEEPTVPPRITDLYYGPDYNYTIEQIIDIADKYSGTVTDAENKDVIDLISNENIVSLFQGKSEAGPRALGNRSLLADPRGADIKERVNAIKQRQQFRPFAPVILEEVCHEYFDMPTGWPNSRYMQTVAYCRQPDLYPAIIHADRTSRVQTVPADGSGIRQLLEAWFEWTGCPMLLNTSLNIKGQPIVNDEEDAKAFAKHYGVKVHVRD